MNYPEELISLRDEFMDCMTPVGSQVTCNPPPPLEDSDIDMLCFIPDMDTMCELEDELDLSEWKFCSGEGYDKMQGDFNAWRKDIDGKNYNLILTTNSKFFEDFLDATKSCKQKNLLLKGERCAEFDRVFKEKREARIPKYIVGRRINKSYLDKYIAEMKASYEKMAVEIEQKAFQW